MLASDSLAHRTGLALFSAQFLAPLSARLVAALRRTGYIAPDAASQRGVDGLIGHERVTDSSGLRSLADGPLWLDVYDLVV